MSTSWIHGSSVAWALVAAALLIVPVRDAASSPTGAAARRGSVGSVSTASSASVGAVSVSGASLRAAALSQSGLAACAVLVCAACVLAAGPVVGLGVSAVLGPLTWLVLDRVRSRPPPVAPDPALPLALDLVAATLRTGRPVDEALARAAPATAPQTAAELVQVAGLLRLGAGAEQAWAAVRPGGALSAVAAVAVRSATSGIRVATAFEQLATHLRAVAATRDAARAQRAGIGAMGPLAACFLPSFVCLGVVPVVVGIAHNALALLP